MYKAFYIEEVNDSFNYVRSNKKFGKSFKLSPVTSGADPQIMLRNARK